ncbi:MAG: AAA family ATPase [Eubacterium sp.]
MGLPVLILGSSGSGKSTSLRNFKEGDIGIINVLGKPLPFQNKLKTVVTDEYEKVTKTLFNCKASSVVIDDAGYLITNQFMKGHSSAGIGNAIFGFYNKVGDNFWGLIEFIIRNLPPNKIVYIMMHEDKNDFGDIKPKTIGKILDEKVCIEGMFTIALRCAINNGKHVFFTQKTDNDVSKSPMGMFEENEIENDLKMVDRVIRNYYGLTGGIENVNETTRV